MLFNTSNLPYMLVRFADKSHVCVSIRNNYVNWLQLQNALIMGMKIANKAYIQAYEIVDWSKTNMSSKSIVRLEQYTNIFKRFYWSSV